MARREQLGQRRSGFLVRAYHYDGEQEGNTTTEAWFADESSGRGFAALVAVGTVHADLCRCPVQSADDHVESFGEFADDLNEQMTQFKESA
ncbi:MAG: hypothetical protein AMXMBFR56_65660 [Polyangiaceae bacterium]